MKKFVSTSIAALIATITCAPGALAEEVSREPVAAQVAEHLAVSADAMQTRIFDLVMANAEAKIALDSARLDADKSLEGAAIADAQGDAVVWF